MTQKSNRERDDLGWMDGQQASGILTVYENAEGETVDANGDLISKDDMVRARVILNLGHPPEE